MINSFNARYIINEGIIWFVGWEVESFVVGERILLINHQMLGFFALCVKECNNTEYLNSNSIKESL